MTDLRSNWEWREWGRRDPLYAVASLPTREKGGSNEWRAEEFLQMGAADFAQIEHHWRHYGMGSRHCIEIGCGAGRMTSHLVHHFERVTAVDVSSDQIATAKRLLGDDTVRVAFHLVDAPAIPVEAGECDGMFTTHVFQHLSSVDAIRSYLALTCRALQPGGTICVHIPVPGAHPTMRMSAGGEALFRLKNWARRKLGIPLMEYHRYQTSDVVRMLSMAGFEDIELRLFTLRSTDDPHSFFFARKPGRQSR